MAGIDSHRVQGVLLIILSVGMLLQGLVYYEKQKDTIDCLQDNFAELSMALEARAKLQTLEADATRNVITSAAQGNYDEESFNIALREYVEIVTKVKRLREENPVPPYPLGECG